MPQTYTFEMVSSLLNYKDVFPCQLLESQIITYDSFLSLYDLVEAPFQMEERKVLVQDHFPSYFYKTFWEFIGTNLY